MKLLIVVLLVCVFAYPVIAEERKSEEEAVPGRTGDTRVTITLTKDQLTKINDAGKNAVIINLTSEQIKAISKEFIEFKGKTMKVNTAQLRNNSMVELTVDAAGEANPQPSP
jgi:hypothetical protein